MPVSGSTTTKPSIVQKTANLLMNERANSNENSNDTLSKLLGGLNLKITRFIPPYSDTPSNSQLGINEESNTAFSEVGFDSDSNQASNLISDQSRQAAGSGGSTDFSALIREEKNEKEGK